MSALLYDLLVDMINFIKYVYFFTRDIFYGNKDVLDFTLVAYPF